MSAPSQAKAPDQALVEHDTGLREPLLQAADSLKAHRDKGKKPAYVEPAYVRALSLTEPTQPITVGWRGTLIWASFIVLWYVLLQHAVRIVVPSSEEARVTLFNTVPKAVYYYSEAAFFVATMLNLVNLVFEDTPEKQQLALLSAVIKGLSWHSDHLIVTGKAVVKLDRHGVLLMPSRYVQWSCSTPTMIFTLSRISSLVPLEVAVTMLADWLMVVCGYAAAEFPWPFAAVPLALSFVCFAYVLKNLRRILDDAMQEAGNPHARMCLRFTEGSTLVVWNLFWVAWLVGHSGIPVISVWGEPLTMLSNFSAKVVFSTSIMYNNFVTLAQRRRAAQLAREHTERVQAVRELSVAVSRKDAFLEVVGHELRTPLNAIQQLSSALAVGAGGPLSVQAREWLSTIKASATHLLGVVHDILTFRATQATSVQLQQELVSINDVIDEVMRQLLPGSGPHITLEKVVHARLPLVVADRRRLVLALSNLVANAIKFMDKATGHIVVKAYPDRGARHVIIKVVDNGPGLSAGQLAALASTSGATLESNARRAGGLGLGLPITHQLMAAHGGVCRLSSPGQGQGTTALLRLPVLQARTDGSLRPEFSAAYQALGYNLEQLLSPELAAVEGRVCPTFTPLTATYSNNPDRTSSAASVSSGPNAVPGGQAPPSEPCHLSATSFQSGANAAPRAAAPLVVLPATNNLFTPAHRTTPALNSRVSASSASSSFDMARSAITQTYNWNPMAGGPGLGGGAAAYPAPAGGPGGPGMIGAAGGVRQSTEAEPYVPGRPSEDSLAAWEAYAEQMGYTTPSVSTAHSDATPPMGGGMNAPAPLPAPTAAGTARGIPGAAVALMSSLYTAADSPHRASLNPGSGGMGRKGPRRPSHGIPPARDSIEESAEEGFDEGYAPDMRAAGSIDAVPTPRQAGRMDATGRTSDVSAMDDGATTEALLTAAAQATQVVNVAAQKLSTTVHDLEAVSEALLEADAAAERAAKHGSLETSGSRGTSDWEQYVVSGTGAAKRADAPEVVADNVRLSMQYTQAAAQAKAKGLPLDPNWSTWVARIPEHHLHPDSGGDAQ